MCTLYIYDYIGLCACACGYTAVCDLRIEIINLRPPAHSFFAQLVFFYEGYKSFSNKQVDIHV